ncbi:ankyrin repeat-containing domain protein, partial [Dactylonectria estremocensis]
TKLLLEKGADLEATGASGRTPLSWQAGNGCEAVVKLLLEKGADLEAKDDNGRTPLLRVGESGGDAIAKLLLEKGANLEAKDCHDLTPLLWAASNGREAVATLLLEKGADLEAKGGDGFTPSGPKPDFDGLCVHVHARHPLHLLVALGDVGLIYADGVDLEHGRLVMFFALCQVGM